MKSWTRTLNLDDAHTLLAKATVGRSVKSWADACYADLPALSMARRRELVRMLRNGFLETADGRIAEGCFLQTYLLAPASAQIDLVHTQWALTHPLSVIAAERLVAPALEAGELDIPLDDVEALVAAHLETSSAESRRKTRPVPLGAPEGIGVLDTSGTGQHRALRASRGTPHPITFGYLVQRELAERGADAMLAREVLETGLGARLTQCGPAHARTCLAWNLDHGVLQAAGDEIRAPGATP